MRDMNEIDFAICKARIRLKDAARDNGACFVPNADTKIIASLHDAVKYLADAVELMERERQRAQE